MSTPAVEEYLELLYRLDAAAAPARPADIARGLGVSTAAVAEMLARLEAERLVSRGDGRTVRLTSEGFGIGGRRSGSTGWRSACFTASSSAPGTPYTTRRAASST